MQTQHLSDECLVSLLDGELSPRKRHAAQKHLDRCWECRTRMAEFEGQIQHFTRLLREQSDPPPAWVYRARQQFHERAHYIRAMAESEARSDRPSWFATHRLNPGLLAAAAACLLAALAFHWLHSPARVSAHELLQRAVASDLNTTRAASGKVVRQRVQVRRKSLRTGQETTAFRDCWFGLSQPVTEPAANGSLVDELRGVYRANGLDWNAPLAVAGVARWRSNLHAPSESVTLDGNFVLTVEDRTAGRGAEDQLRLIRLFLRPADMHPVQQELETNQARYGVSEVSLAVVDPPVTIRAGSAVPVHPAQPSLPETNGAPTREPVPSLADRLQADYAIHEAGACHGSMLEVVELPGEGLAVRGVVDTEERKQALTLALNELPAVKSVTIETIDEASRKAAQMPAAAANAGPSMVLRSTSFALEKPLYAHYRKAHAPEQAHEQTSLLIDKLLGRSASAAQEAAVLKHLAKTYPAGKLAALPDSSRQLLTRMVREHSRLLALDLKDVRSSLAIVESVLEVEPANSELAEDRPPDWNRDGVTLTESVHELEARIWALLTHAPESFEQKRDAVSAVSRGLQESGHRLEGMLAAVEEFGDRNKTAELNRKTH